MQPMFYFLLYPNSFNPSVPSDITSDVRMSSSVDVSVWTKKNINRKCNWQKSQDLTCTNYAMDVQALKKVTRM